jgi:putative hydrolase of the HAD superfamily
VTRAVFFDVDFTLIHPGPTFGGAGYQTFARKYGLDLDPARFDAAVRSASVVLDTAEPSAHDPQVFIEYTRTLMEHMGASGDSLVACATEIYDQWAECHHFHLYDDVVPVLNRLHENGVLIGLISNTHRCLEAFQRHFELDGLVAGAISSSQHGFMKPHPSIFEAAMRLLRVEPAESVMVGDSYRHDIEGATLVGMRGVLVCRSGAYDGGNGVPVIRSLDELPPLL